MVWVIVIALVVVLGIVMRIFYRHAQDVDSELKAEAGGGPPPMFGATQRRIRRNTHGS